MKRFALAFAVMNSLLATILPAQSMFRGGPNHTGVLADKAPRQFHGVKWRFPTGDRVISSPVFADGTIYFGSDDGNIYAVDPSTGMQKWKKATGGPVSSTPAIEKGTLYAGSYGGKFYALNAQTGSLKWRFAIPNERRFEAKGFDGRRPKAQTFSDGFDVYLSSPVVAQGAVYFGCGDGNLYAVDIETGEQRWKFQTGDVIHASPAYADGTLFVGSWDSFFYAVDASSGKEKWRFKTGEDPVVHNQVGFSSSPAIANGIVYTGCRDAHLYAIDAVTGKEKWNFFTDLSWVVTSPAVIDNKVLFGTSDTGLFYICDATTGKELVKQQAQAWVFSSPVVAGDVVLNGLLNGMLEARDLKTGELLWDFQTEMSKKNPGWILTADRKINGPLLFQSQWHDKIAVAIQQQNAIGSIFSSALVVNGIVYIGSSDGYLYALE